jgi:YHS domain-containing protein
MKSFVVVTMLAGLVMGLATATRAAESAAASCPVSGKKAGKVSTAYHGGEIYFCCKKCLKAFKQDQEKFSTKANQQLVMTGQVSQQKCPITGRKIKSGTELKVGGIDVAFCCKNCRKQVDEAGADDQLELVFSNEAFGKGFGPPAASQ